MKMSFLESSFKYITDSKNIKLIVIVAILSCVGSYFAIDELIIKEKVSRIEELNKDKNHLASQLKDIQNRLEKQIDSEDSRLEKNVANVKALYNEVITDLNRKNNQLMQERDTLISQLAQNAHTTQLEINKRNNENILALRQTLNSVEKNIHTLYLTHSRLSSEYGYSQKECEKRGSDFYGNICEQSSKYKAELDSLGEQIKSQEQRRKFIQEEILSIQRGAIN